jgi:CBS domain-containing protein
MVRRKRRSTQQGEYEDPLKDYGSPTYADQTERALCEGQLSDLQTTPFITVDVDQTVEQTLAMMAEKNIAYLMVIDRDRLVGIFSERDVLYRVAERYHEIKDGPISQVMTTNPVSVYETDSPAKALNLMAVGGFRHLPILNVDEKIVGVLGPRRVTTHLCKHFSDRQT